MSAGELLGFDSGGAALHVHDLAVPERDNHGIPPPQLSLFVSQLRGANDLVVTDASEREIVDRPSAGRLQDLTGLVWSASRGCVFPPETAARGATPLGVLREHRDERLGVASIQRLGRGAQLLDHSRSMARPGSTSGVASAMKAGSVCGPSDWRIAERSARRRGGQLPEHGGLLRKRLLLSVEGIALGQLARVEISDMHPLGVLPDEHSQRQLDADTRV